MLQKKCAHLKKKLLILQKVIVENIRKEEAKQRFLLYTVYSILELVLQFQIILYLFLRDYVK